MAFTYNGEYFSGRDLMRFFEAGLPKEGLLTPKSLSSISPQGGILLIDRENSSYEKLQIYRGSRNGKAFRVTSGWYERGTLVERALSIDRMCAIGPGYPINYFDVPKKLILEHRVYLVKSFEPNVFGRKKPQENADIL